MASFTDKINTILPTFDDQIDEFANSMANNIPHTVLDAFQIQEIARPKHNN